MMKLDIAHAQIIGSRAEQQDAADARALGSGGDGALLVLADGLGGHASGAEAARIVVETFREAVADGSLLEQGARRQQLNSVLLEANHRIHEATDPGHGQRSMASTAVSAILSRGTVRWISVGDSHLYVCRKGRLVKLNADHSQAGLMVKHGYSPNDAAVINARAVLVSALTGRDIEAIDNPPHDIALENGDVVLLASDGLNTLSEAEIALAIDQAYDSGADAICQTLLDAVTARGIPRQDNTTVVVARVLSIGDAVVVGAAAAAAGQSDREVTATDVPTLPLQSAAATLGEAEPVTGPPGNLPEFSPIQPAPVKAPAPPTPAAAARAGRAATADNGHSGGRDAVAVPANSAHHSAKPPAAAPRKASRYLWKLLLMLILVIAAATAAGVYILNTL